MFQDVETHESSKPLAARWMRAQVLEIAAKGAE
jgi:hypothetical protein